MLKQKLNLDLLIQPRYPLNLFLKCFIGNRSQYAARALASPNSKVQLYIQVSLGKMINEIFTDKPKFIAAFGTG